MIENRIIDFIVKGGHKAAISNIVLVQLPFLVLIIHKLKHRPSLLRYKMED